MAVLKLDGEICSVPVQVSVRGQEHDLALDSGPERDKDQVQGKDQAQGNGHQLRLDLLVPLHGQRRGQHSGLRHGRARPEGLLPTRVSGRASR